MLSSKMTSLRTALADSVRRVLADRYFSGPQIEKILPHLSDEYFKEPTHLNHIIDRWNILFNNILVTEDDIRQKSGCIPPLAKPPPKSLGATYKIDMTNILADVAPELLLFDPDQLYKRHTRLQSLGFIKNMGEHWTVLFNAPRGFYLQDWSELTKKIYYIEQNIINLIYEKKDQREMVVHPLIKSAAATEADYDHIRTRFLFASRSGYKTLSHMFSIQTAMDKPNLTDVILSDNKTYLKKFAPFCSLAEYNCFSNMIKNYDIDEDDSEIYEKFAELEKLSY